jgi:cell division protein FtsB
MAVSVTWWNRLSWTAVFLMFAVGGVAAAFWILPEIQLNQRLQRQKIEAAAEVDGLRQELAVYQFRVFQWEHNPAAVERLAREKLGYSKSGETVIFFKPPSPRVTDLSRTPPDPPASAR